MDYKEPVFINVTQKIFDELEEVRVENKDDDQVPPEDVSDFGLSMTLSDIMAEKATITNVQNSSLRHFVQVQRKDDSVYFVRKSSILWMLLKNKKRIPSDRMLRFITEKGNNLPSENVLEIGRYAAFLINQNILLVGQVLSFQYMTGKKKSYTLDFCALEKKDDDNAIDEARGIKVLCSFYDLKRNEEGDIKLKLLSDKNMQYFNINDFFCHVNVILRTENELIDYLLLSPESKAKLVDKLQVACRENFHDTEW